MKKMFSVLMIPVLLLAFGCKKENKTVNEVSDISGSSWRLTLFSDKNQDETAMFNGYIFVFEKSGKLLATKNDATQEGTWREDRIANKLVIDLGRPEAPNLPLGELTDEWVITAISSSIINLADENVDAGKLVEFRIND